MQRLFRILLVVVVLLGGAAIAPSLALPAQPFSWQLFAGAYQQPKTIEIRDFAFAPNVVLIPVGTTVRWMNNDAMEHTVTGNTGLFDQTLGPGDSFEFRFDAPGTYPYHCKFHPSMTGTVVVVNQVFDVYLPIVSKTTP